MQELQILTLGNQISNNDLYFTLESFALFYHSITPKHKRKCSIVVVDKLDIEPELNKMVKDLKLINKVTLISIDDQKMVEKSYESAHLFILASETPSIKILREALFYSIPILTFYHHLVEELNDKSSGCFVRKNQYKQGLSEFCAFIEMIYFDPAARKLLIAGANNKYQKLYNLSCK